MRAVKTRRLCSAVLLLLYWGWGAPLYGADQPQSPAVKKHPLWSVPGERATVHLLGSIHLLKPEHYPLAPVINAAFSNAQVIVFEADVAQMQAAETQLKLLSKASLPAGQTLKDRLSPQTHAKFSRFLAEAGLPAFVFESLQPAFAAVTVLALELQKLGFDPQLGVDRHFFERARQLGKEIVPLETVDFQIGLLTDLSKEDGEAFLQATMEEAGQLKSILDKLVPSWQAGDGETVAALMNDAMADYPALYKRMVTDRNAAWVPKIEALLRGDKDALVVVGTAHLMGKDGVIELLRRRGWNVAQE